MTRDELLRRLGAGLDVDQDLVARLSGRRAVTEELRAAMAQEASRLARLAVLDMVLDMERAVLVRWADECDVSTQAIYVVAMNFDHGYGLASSNTRL